jgi:alkylated DNA nucleotide flippase Atl1
MTRPERALQVWQVLVGAADNRQLLTYEILAKLIGMGAGTMAQTLGIIMRYCDERDLPPLTAIVVKKSSGVPGTGLTTLREINRDREKVYSYPWYRQTPPQLTEFEQI